jgi:peptide methionine sulfoxide reductase msrA/msrB
MKSLKLLKNKNASSKLSKRRKSNMIGGEKKRKKYKKKRTVYFSGGCFWGIQHKFNTFLPSLKTEVGYMGGFTINPSYEEVSTGITGYAETIKIMYDTIDFKGLLEYFFRIHNPTTLNRQGNDFGTQYRSIVFYQNLKEKKIYERFINTLPYKDKIVTELLPAKDYKFYKAEEYHQDYKRKV